MHFRGRYVWVLTAILALALSMAMIGCDAEMLKSLFGPGEEEEPGTPGGGAVVEGVIAGNIYLPQAYSTAQTGDMRLIVAIFDFDVTRGEVQNPQPINIIDVLNPPFPFYYEFRNLDPNKDYWVFAFLDFDGNGRPNTGEIFGVTGPRRPDDTHADIQLNQTFFEGGGAFPQLNYVGLDIYQSSATIWVGVIDGSGSGINTVEVDLKAPGGEWYTILLQFDSGTNEWRGSWPISPASGDWWISRVEMWANDGSWAKYYADNAHSNYYYDWADSRGGFGYGLYSPILPPVFYVAAQPPEVTSVWLNVYSDRMEVYAYVNSSTGGLNYMSADIYYTTYGYPINWWSSVTLYYEPANGWWKGIWWGAPPTGYIWWVSYIYLEDNNYTWRSYYNYSDPYGYYYYDDSQGSYSVYSSVPVAYYYYGPW
ncbi:MAG: hypothetical protein ACUVXI_10700 [bacterium]